MATRAVMKTEMVPFHGHVIQSWVDGRDQQIYVGMRILCNDLGLSWAGQYQRLIRSSLLKEHTSICTTHTGAGARETLGLKLEMLPAWLIGINPDRIAPRLRETILLFQQESAAVLAEYWKPLLEPVVEGTATPLQAIADATHGGLKTLLEAMAETKPITPVVPQLTEDSLGNRLKHLELIDKAYTFWAKSGGLTEKRTARLNWLAGALVFQSGEANTTALQAG